MRMKYVSLGRIFIALLGVMVGAVVMTAPQPVYAQAAVSSILVQGNQRVEDEAVRAYVQIKRGQYASAEKVNESLKDLFATGLFSDVQIHQSGSTLVVKVQENPLINKVSFEGNSKLKDDALAKETTLRERSVLTKGKVQTDVQRLTTLYRRSGYYRVKVEPKVIRLSQNRVNLIYEVTEGAETSIESISFVGNNAFSDSQLRSVITTTESAWWKILSTTDNYDPDRLAYDQELLRRHYLKFGFADFKVVSANAELAQDGESFYITFTVEEGPQYNIGNVVFNAGSTTLKGDKLAGVIETQSGERYDASKVDKSIENITTEAGKEGYAFARVEPRIERDPANRKLDIHYDVQEGPRTYIERIDIIGNTRTLDKVIRRELRLVEGDAYNRILVERARRNLTALDFFEKIDIREEPGSAPDKVVMVIEVVEKSTGTINFSAGYSTSEQVIGTVSVTERNLMGRGQYIRLNTALSFHRQSVDFSFTEPYFLDRKLSAGVDAYANFAQDNDSASYDAKQYGGGPRLGFLLDEKQRIDVRYNYTYRKIDPDDDSSYAIRNMKKKTNTSLFGLEYTYDDLDNPLRPTSGLRFELTGDLAGAGGDVHYFRSEARAYYFMPLFYDGVVMKMKATAGHVNGWSGDRVQVIDRFSKGGDSFRGFEVGGVGPQMQYGSSTSTDGRDSIGGQTYAIGTLEVSFPLGLPDSFGISGAAFTDFGTVFGAPEHTGDDPNCKKCRVFDSKKFRLSVGAGLIWDSPFGPLRLDAAYPLLKASSDKKELFRFSVASRF